MRPSVPAKASRAAYACYKPEQQAHERWLAQAIPEEVIEPSRRIIDAHHHLWDLNSDAKARAHVSRFLTDEFARDIAESGHNITHTCYMQSSSAGWRRNSGPAELRVVGETEFAQGVAVQAESGKCEALLCAGIVATADMLLGKNIDQVLEAHQAVRNFRGLRFCGGKAETIPFQDERVLSSLGALQRHGLVFDCNGPETHPLDFSSVLGSLANIAENFPDLTIVVNHCGGAIGPTCLQDAEKLAEWQSCLQTLATHPNVYMKVGGLQMPANGYAIGPTHKDRPPTSEELANLTFDIYSYAISTFGPGRCMFESNFPVDKWGVSYKVLWNTFKRIAARLELTEAEKEAIFHETARRVYGLDKTT